VGPMGEGVRCGMADPPREGGGPSPTGGTEHGSSPAARAMPGTSPPGNGRRRLEDRFEQALGLSRVVVVVPVIVLLLSALASFAYGTDVFVRSVAGVVDDPELSSHNLSFLLLLTDLFLVGATLMIAAFGFYDLFITRIGADGPSLRLPAWLKMHDLNDLKARVISMIILVAAVTFVDVAVASKGGLNTLYPGAAVALVIVALTAFLRFGTTEGDSAASRPPDAPGEPPAQG
jgi:uncharacterized membrane protein YqhA